MGWSWVGGSEVVTGLRYRSGEQVMRGEVSVLRVSRFEMARAMSGRRSRAQMRAADQEGATTMSHHPRSVAEQATHSTR
jgi:hypothetical protein